MSYRRRIYFTNEQKCEIWDRWQRGESMSSILLLNFTIGHQKAPLKLAAVREQCGQN